jgi:DNA invertase Pin-like site-specific DNA recombinase
MKLDGYIRVSKVGGREGASFISPDLQREEIEAWARFKGAEIVEFHVDLDESGSKLQRPGLERAVRRAESGETDGIAIAKLDRFARSLTGALEAIKRLDDAGAVFVSVAEGLDPTTPAGKMMMRLMLIMAEFELDRTRETWNQSRRRAVARGLHLSGTVPTGYRRRDDGRLVPDPETAAQVAALFQMRAEYRTWGEILSFIEQCGLKNPFGEAKWTSPSLSELMANRVYLGEARSGSYSAKGAHEPLVDRGIWEVAQLTRMLTTLNSKRPALLSGLIRCAACRYMMAPGGELNKAGTMRRRYCCKGRSAGGRCANPVRVRGEEVEQLVEATFFELYGGSRLCRRATTDSRQRAQVELEVAEEELAVLQGQNQADLAVDAEMEAMHAVIELARRKVIELCRSTLLESPGELRKRWPRMPVMERRRHFAHLIDAVMLREDRGRGLKDRMLIIPFGSAPADLPHRGFRGVPQPFTWTIEQTDATRVFGGTAGPE